MFTDEFTKTSFYTNHALLNYDRKIALKSGVFFFQAEDGIRVLTVTGVQTCALPIWAGGYPGERPAGWVAGSSCRASGLPAASRSSWSRTGRGRSPAAASSSSRALASSRDRKSVV